MREDVKFGTSGLRGLAAELEAGAAGRHVSAFCRHLEESAGRRGRIYIGRDRRESSERLSLVCGAAAVAAGFDPVDCGLLPTPALALHAMAHDAGAIMVTGSHIPADRNGLKFYVPAGEIGKEDERAIADLAGKGDDKTFAPSRVSMTNDGGAAARRFLARYTDIAEGFSLAGRRIGIWAHSSVATETLARLIGKTGATVIAFGHTETFTPVDTEALTPEARENLAAEAAAGRFDAIVSTDADGDRPLVIDENGRQLPGDLVAFAAVAAGDADAIALPVTCNSAIEGRFSGRIARTRIGSPFVIAAMAELRAKGATAAAGFEANGGLLTAGPLRFGDAELPALPTRDSFLPILATLARLADRQFRLGDLGLEFGFRPARADRLADYPGALAQRLIEELAASGADRSRFTGIDGVVAVGDHIDGIALVGGQGEIVRVRASGNAPELRVYVEAAGEPAAKRLLDCSLRQADAYRAAVNP
jgi:phosphomannomutase